jgi:hypothetical protein
LGPHLTGGKNWCDPKINFLSLTVWFGGGQKIQVIYSVELPLPLKVLIKQFHDVFWQTMMSSIPLASPCHLDTI